MALPIFSTYLWDLLPQYYKTNDTYKDNNDRGLLERFLQVYGDELDQEEQSKIDNYLDILNPLICDSKYLDLISYSLGNVPDIFSNETLYRVLLSNIVSIYKIKGTLKSYELFFSLIGFNITITEYQNIDILYDIPVDYDGIEPPHYDDQCRTCSDYDIAFGNTSNSAIDQTILDILRRAIFFLEPINAKLGQLTYLLAFTEQVDYCGREDVTLQNVQQNAYDIPIFFDGGRKYDEEVLGNSTSLSADCTGDLTNEGIGFWEINNDFIVQ